MFSKLLIKTFVKTPENTSDENVRSAYGFLAGVIGIIVNLFLFGVKLTVGMISQSIAVTADAFNNFTDAGSSLVTILGFKLSNMPADEEHPFGHGRIEYLSALVVSAMVMLVGVEFIRSSIERILNPTPVQFEVIPFVLILFSILFKIWLSRFNVLIGKKINSSALKAAGLDALGDVVTSSTVALSLLASKWTSFPIDGYVGVAVALMILYSGFKLTKETLNPLLGEAPDPELVFAIKNEVMSYDNITGVHDLIIHNYGPGKCMCSIHAEVPANMSVVKIHEIIDAAEKEVSEKLNVYLVIHMDPINVDDAEIMETQYELLKILNDHPIVKSMHDFRVVGSGEKKNLIFDIVVDSNRKKLQLTDEEIKHDICERVKKVYPTYNCVITVDNDFLNYH